MEARNGPDISVLTDMLSFQLRMLSQAINRAYDEAFSATEASSGTGKLTTLLLVSANPGMSQSEVGCVLGKDRPAMVRIVDHLERAGLMQRDRDPAERRRHALTLTPRGEAEIGRYMAIAKAYDGAFFSVLTEEERRGLARIARKLRRIHQPETLGLESAVGSSRG
jgi:DNA-binding MarR family transcriptional regulator